MSSYTLSGNLTSNLSGYKFGFVNEILGGDKNCYSNNIPYKKQKDAIIHEQAWAD